MVSSVASAACYWQIVWNIVGGKPTELPLRQTARLLELLSVNGKSFVEWLGSAGYVPGSPTTGALARDWLKSWSVDLKEFAKDRGLRNDASYRPQRLSLSQSQLSVGVISEKLVRFWRACEPSGFARFGELDLHLLRQALTQAYGAIMPSRSYSVFVRDALDQMGMAGQLHLTRFLSRSRLPQHPILVEAKKRGRDRNGRMRPLSIMARAILLLRLASAACESFLRSSGIYGADIEFWWENLGSDIGLWEPNEGPAYMTDLWADIEAALELVEAWNNENPAPSCNVCQARRELSVNLWYMGQFQRVGLWGIGL